VPGTDRIANRMRWPARAALPLVALLLPALVAAPALAASHARIGSSVRLAPAAVPANANWPTFHGNPGLTGVSGDPTISTLNAVHLGVRWMTHTFGPVLSSPVTKFSAARNQTLAYVANEVGDLEAINTANGSIVWSDSLGVPLHATPSAVGTHLWIGTAVSGRMIKVDANTGAVLCRVSLGTGIDFASPVIARPPGGSRTLFVGVQDNGAVQGPMMAIRDSTCKVEWRRNPYRVFSGSWSPDAYGVNANGVPLVIFGSGDPDCAIYALNASTGATLWRVASLTGGLADFGTGAAISPPGRNGIAHGMAYVAGKDRILYGIDLTTGHLKWHFDYGAATGARFTGGRSTAALAGRTVVFGTPVGVAAVNAVTGKQIWLSENSGPADTEVLSSPLVTGPAGHQVVVYGDLKGYVEVSSLATGQVLYKYKTGGYVISSAADSAGNLIIGSSDGFLYDLALGGSNGTPPATTMSSPVNGSTIPNPGSHRVVARGAATAGSAPVARVDVAVQMNGPSGQWWNARTRRWQQGPAYNQAALGSPGTSRTWSFGVPVPRQGSVLTFIARAVGTDGLVEPHLIQRTMTVRPVRAGPHVTLSARQAAPGTGLRASGKGFGSGEEVRLSLPGVQLATVTARADGSFGGELVRIPRTFDYGLTALTATGKRTGRSVTAPLNITGPWSELGHDPQRSANQPFDHVLSEEVTPGKQYRMTPYWVYSAPARIQGSPAVSDGRAFAGDHSGTLSAVNLVTGGLAWSAPVGGAVDSSPGVDRAAGLIVVGSSNDKVSAYKERSGALAWKTNTGAAVKSSPLIYQGVVYVGSEDHKLYAISEKTGKVRWTATLPGPVDGSPAFDPATSTIVVGDGTGTVTAFHAGQAPSKRWHVRTGGAIVNSPVIESGRVFVGSENGVVYSFSESTGKLKWSRHVGGAVAGSMAYQSGRLYVGAASGRLTALHAGDGSVMWHEPLAGPVTGVSVTNGMLFTESSNGAVTGLRIGGEVVWLARTGAGLTGSPAIMDNAVFVGGEDKGLYCFTPFGEPVV
jgi:outer membrane protein assembly factor BamB